MKKILNFVMCALISIGVADAAVRDTAANNRSGGSTQVASRSTTTQKTTEKNSEKTAARTATTTVTQRATTSTTARNTTDTTTAPQSRSATTSRTATSSATAPAMRGSVTVAPARSAISQRTQISSPKTTVARAADTMSSTITETRTGAEYEQCKTAYFTCMDQFCKLKNDDYRRCSCSDRVYELGDVRTVLQDAGTKLTEFTENLDTVGMTAAQATAMRTASEGEDALTSDGSASKALLQAIMNSIRGGDTNVGGKFSDLNSINISFDTANAFGITDSGQAIAAYNGKNLYSVIYSQCRNAVRPDCNDASLQRAVTAYLMAIEQDCNTVQTAISENQKQMTAAVREGGAMLDLARVENRQKHNADDMTECMANVEKAILSEEVCGANYHKCLDNGEFIDLTTGAPIAGVVKFYELEHLLTFKTDASVDDQKLSKISSNRTFVQNFEKRVKKFAEPALDRCTEKAADVWADYLDKAMLDIYYSQKAKVAEIKQGCFDFVSSCYVNGDNALTAAMLELAGDAGVTLQPDKIVLNSAICKDYVDSCDNMFDGNIVRQYIENRKDTDTLTACRAVAKQCFDKFGGTGYENFYYRYSGLFSEGQAPDWFTLYDKNGSYKSECAKQLAQISSCSDADMMERAFGGFDIACRVDAATGNVLGDDCDYGLLKDATSPSIYSKDVGLRDLRPTGVATEIYYQIIDILKTQCDNMYGRFVELQFLKIDMYNTDNICLANFSNGTEGYSGLVGIYGIATGENMCPKGYTDTVDIKSWGACLCWENGARRSRFGTSVKCVAELPIAATTDSASCSGQTLTTATDINGHWCTQGSVGFTKNQVCPMGATVNDSGYCEWSGSGLLSDKIPEGVK